jgi:uncharacterized membrane protein YhaH (DUF805 family)
MSWYIEVIKKYAVFTGRARRKEYWMFFLFNIIIALILDILLQTTTNTVFYYISIIYSLGLFLPGLGVSIRRLHDIGKSGWNILFGLIPFVGCIILIVFFCQDSQPGTNQYGDSPKEQVDEALKEAV